MILIIELQFTTFILTSSRSPPQPPSPSHTLPSPSSPSTASASYIFSSADHGSQFLPAQGQTPTPPPQTHQQPTQQPFPAQDHQLSSNTPTAYGGTQQQQGTSSAPHDSTAAAYYAQGAQPTQQSSQQQPQYTSYQLQTGQVPGQAQGYPSSSTTQQQQASSMGVYTSQVSGSMNMPTPNPTPPPSQASIAPATGVSYLYPPGSTNPGVLGAPATGGYAATQQQLYSQPQAAGYSTGFAKNYTQRAYQAYPRQY
jgi:hypothetical protein